MFKTIFKLLFKIVCLLVIIWSGLYIMETASNPFGTREQNITRVNVAIINQFNARKKEISVLFRPDGKNEQNDSILRLPNRTFSKSPEQ